MTKVMGVTFVVTLYNTVTSFLLAFFLLLAWMKPVNILGRLMWQEIKDSLQPITRWKLNVASDQQQPIN